ncbi:Vacuolar protein-sorting-associated protein [Spathaspora sp. JA1]|nr:Vacuolar protein-sorting-associated protein [Spathaspora sp. JA1]
MSYLNIWQPLLINTSNRPILNPSESIAFFQDSIGIYQGQQKITLHQNGRLYLTNQRIIYFDNDNAQERSIFVDMSRLIGCGLVDGFFRSSPKVKLFLRTNSESDSDFKVKTTTKENNLLNWPCKICSFNNVMSYDFDIDSDELPKCGSCGIPPTVKYLEQVIKSSRENSLTPTPEQQQQPRRDDQCPQCTFINHPSMKYCEICGSELKSTIPDALLKKITPTKKPIKKSDLNPLGLALENDTAESYSTPQQPYIKISFRKGGANKFYQHVANIIDEIKWSRLKSAGGIDQNGVKLKSTNLTPSTSTSGGGGGIHALEMLDEQQRRQNELVLTSSLNDLEQLMFKYQDLIKLSGSFNQFIKQKNNNTNNRSNIHYTPSLNARKISSPQELSRHISEYLMNYELTTTSSMITSQDLFANYNRFLLNSQGFGSDLIPASDFNKSLELFNQLNLPVSLRKYEKSGILVITKTKLSKESYGEYIVNCIREQEHEYNLNKYQQDVLSVDLENTCFPGVTIGELSSKLNWSNNITIEETEICIDQGILVIDQNISGTFYHINKFEWTSEHWENDSKQTKNQIQDMIIKQQKNISQELKTEYERVHGGAQDQLVDLMPSFAIGENNIEEEEEEESSEVEEMRPNNSQSQSLNDLAGLQF